MCRPSRPSSSIWSTFFWKWVASSLDWGTDDEMAEREELTRLEELGGDLRLAYVALTRAKHHISVLTCVGVTHTCLCPSA